MQKFYGAFLALMAIVFSVSVNAQIVISQVYGGGGNSGATYKNDFIELFNPSTSTVSLAGWSVQYASATGTSWSVTTL
jgi:predicted extracellular nuclease